MPVVCLCVRTVHTDEAEDEDEDVEGFRVYCIEYTLRASPLIEPQMSLYLRPF
jgi:hypothetical protein